MPESPDKSNYLDQHIDQCRFHQCDTEDQEVCPAITEQTGRSESLCFAWRVKLSGMFGIAHARPLDRGILRQLGLKIVPIEDVSQGRFSWMT